MAILYDDCISCTIQIGDDGPDFLIGDNDRDFLRGLNGRDTLLGLAGSDRLGGGGHRDHLDGGEGADYIRGGTGRDVLYGDAGADWIIGGAGKDFISGGDGSDTLKGGSGADVFLFEQSEGGFDTITDFSAEDTLQFDDFNLTPFSYGMIFEQVGADVHVKYVNFLGNGGIGPSAISPVPSEDLVAIVLNADAAMVQDNSDFAGSFF